MTQGSAAFLDEAHGATPAAAALQSSTGLAADSTAGQARPERVQAGAGASIDRVLDSVAGFFQSESQAQETLRRLNLTEGLLDAQVLLLGPTDAAWLPFMLHTRRWVCRPRQDRQPWFRDVWLAALVGALVAVLLCAVSLSLDDGLPLFAALPAFTLAALTGAAAGVGAGWWSKQPAHLEQFAGIVRKQLGAGRWVLLVHGVPWERQARAVALLREDSLNWCAVSVAQGAL
jgi:hypothetical protein